MEFTVQEVAALVGGRLASDTGSTTKIRGVAAVADAESGEITFFGNAKYLPQLKASRATAALVPLDFAEAIPALAILVENPSLAFARLMEKFAPASIRYSPGVHPTAVLGRNVVLGENVSIQPFVVIEDGVEIGANTIVGAHGYIGHEAHIGQNCHFAARVTIGARCEVGNRVIIHSGAVLGSDGFGFEPVGGKHIKIAQTGIVQVDDDVEIGANTTIDRARFGRTWIQQGTKIDNLVQIAHNVVVGKHCILVSQTGVSGSTRLGNYVTLAGQVGIVGHVEIGDQVIVAAKSGVSKSVAPKEVFFGYPATPIKEQKEQLACIARLPRLYARVKKLEQVSDSQGKSSPPAS
ncbi:MAG: UDP-3-O-(3-hydroxymyristoyl)glucosamine N-acyltransferase [Chthoniobacter sp.]|uniref:UDP-3-O-(3-hydroxymyristoyl)glucosamine N-acyltransferase n=1 Tax=Chthoniobacter sp. TaxID=2510640 RepID=UPI0032A3E794